MPEGKQGGARAARDAGRRAPARPTAAAQNETQGSPAEREADLARYEARQRAAAEVVATRERREAALTCAALVFKGRRVRADRVLLLARDLEQYLANG